jgi:soluble lytic murein transglycosylase-like protein
MKNYPFILIYICFLFICTHAQADIVKDFETLAMIFRSKITNYNMKNSTTWKPHHRYWHLIVKAGKKHNLNPYLIYSVIKHESNFNPNAVSHKNARGLMQLMPDTARMLNVNNSFNPAQNIDGGSNYLRQMISTFKGNLYKALMAYNAGPNNIIKGVYPRESKIYAKKVLVDYKRLRRI